MIRPPGFRGAAFGTAADGDAHRDPEARRRIAAALGIGEHWAFCRQVHGHDVLQVAAPGVHGAADGLITTKPELPLAVKTADCVPVVLEGEGAVATLHAGWRGIAAGVIENGLRLLGAVGIAVERAALGPAIGPCCYEVGEEVAARFPEHVARTDAGATSVDLVEAVAVRLAGIDVWRAGVCTHCDPGLHSFRRDRTDRRQVSVAWLPTG